MFAPRSVLRRRRLAPRDPAPRVDPRSGAPARAPAPMPRMRWLS